MRNALKVLLVLAFAIPTMASAAISSTKHNLSATGTGLHFTDTTADMCKFCHIVHNASTTGTALWGRAYSATSLPAFTTATTVAGTALPQTYAALGDATTKCLSCHDGTVALNTTVNRLGTTTVVAASNTIAAGTSTATTVTVGSGVGLASGLGYFANLAGQHPVGIPFAGGTGSSAATNEYAAFTTTGCAGTVNCTTSGTGGVYIKLYGTTAATAKVECGSCHEPHKSTEPFFLRVPGTVANARCGSCHIK
jgi:predicted CXXCH cytochrome family protein